MRSEADVIEISIKLIYGLIRKGKTKLCSKKWGDSVNLESAFHVNDFTRSTKQ